ncbi:MAG TPA: tetratricopeptide repeat protein, partial [Geobacterales bacterium]|nr:tetratricopeptide repeat protein [Geobacterales bacterium]
MPLYIRDFGNRQGGDQILARYQQIQGRINSAPLAELIGELEGLVALSNGFAAAHNDLAVLYHRSGRKEQSLQSFERAVALDPASTVYRKNLADFYYVELQRVEDALRLYTDVLSDAPADVETLFALAMVSRDLGGVDDARIFLEKALALEPCNKAVGDLYRSLGGDNDPEELFKAALKALQGGELDRGIALMNQVVVAVPDNANAINILAILYLRHGSLDQAMQLSKAALALQGDNVEYLRTLASCQQAKGDIEESVQTYLSVLSLDPGNVASLLELGRISIDLKEYRNATFFLNKVLEGEFWNVTAWQEMDRLLDQVTIDGEPVSPELRHETTAGHLPAVGGGATV